MEEEQLVEKPQDVRPRTEEQRKKIYRYKRITHLVEPLRNMVDEGNIKLSIGEKLSFLTHAGQNALAEYILTKKQKISEKQATHLRDLENEVCLNQNILEEFFHPNNTVQPLKEVKLKIKDISDYLPAYVLENNSAREYILKALSFYQSQQSSDEI